MKTLLVRLQFKLASWLYNQGIIAPQLLEHKIIRVMNDEEMEVVSSERYTPVTV